MILFGTTTSPFVRRVRVAAMEIGQTFELVKTADDAGQARLRQISPIWKVPVAQIDGQTLFDSRTIIEWLTTTRGFGGIAPPRNRFRDLNLLNAIDGALESGIQLFYLQRENVKTDGLAFADKQKARIKAIFTWLESELSGDGFGSPLGLTEISLICALDWFEFRKLFDVSAFGKLLAVRNAWSDRPSLKETTPRES